LDVGFQGLCNYEKVSKLLLELVLGILLIILMGHVSLVWLLGWSNISSFLLCFQFVFLWVGSGLMLFIFYGFG